MEILTFLCGRILSEERHFLWRHLSGCKTQHTRECETEPSLFMFSTEATNWAFLLWKLWFCLVSLREQSPAKPVCHQFQKMREHWRLGILLGKERRYLSNTLTILLMRIVCGCKCSISYLRAIRCISTTRQARAERSQKTENTVLPKAQCFEG